MKKHFVFIFSLLMGFAVVNSALADDSAIKATFQKIGVADPEITDSPVPELKAVASEAGMFYVSKDGKYLLQGPLMGVDDKGKVTNLTNKMLLNKLNALESSMIIYKAPEEKYVVTVFTDTSCSYCQKLHHNIKQYNDLGITIRYLAYPRSGLDSPVGKQMQAIWCSKDKAKAFEQVSKGESLDAQCYIGTIANQYKLGLQYGLRGTPAIVFSNGDVVPGYIPPKELKEELDKRIQSQ